MHKVPLFSLFYVPSSWRKVVCTMDTSGFFSLFFFLLFSPSIWLLYFHVHFHTVNEDLKKVFNQNINLFILLFPWCDTNIFYKVYFCKFIILPTHPIREQYCMWSNLAWIIVGDYYPYQTSLASLFVSFSDHVMPLFRVDSFMCKCFNKKKKNSQENDFWSEMGNLKRKRKRSIQ